MSDQLRERGLDIAHDTLLKLVATQSSVDSHFRHERHLDRRWISEPFAHQSDSLLKAGALEPRLKTGCRQGQSIIPSVHAGGPERLSVLGLGRCFCRVEGGTFDVAPMFASFQEVDRSGEAPDIAELPIAEILDRRREQQLADRLE